MPETAPSPALSDAYQLGHFDALTPTELLAAEVAQRRETGFDVDHVVQQANALDPEDSENVLALLDSMTQTTRTLSWRYEEPDDLAGIADSVAARPTPSTPDPQRLAERTHAAWLGRIIGCTLGKPVEMGSHWTRDHIRDYLVRADAYPLVDYVPVLQPMPEGFVLREFWDGTTLGTIDGAYRDDDIDYTILALHLLETHGAGLAPHHVAQAWMELLPLRQTYTAERAAYVNLARGLSPASAAAHRNPYREWIGAQIRGDAFGYVHPGDPWGAAVHAYQDARLSHTGNGIYGEMWSAALNAAAFGAADAHEAVTVSAAVVPARSRLREALDDVIGLFEAKVSWEAAIEHIETRYGHYSWVHTVNNAAVVAAGLLWSEGDFTTAIGRTVVSGWDTDSNGATVGSVAGILFGTEAIPPRFADPIDDRTRSALFGFDNSRISFLAERTVALTRSGTCNVG